MNNSNIVKEDEIMQFYQAKDVVLESDEDDFFTSFTNPMKMYYKINKCFNLIEKEGSKERYDLVIRIRPDIKFLDLSNFNIVDIYNRIINHDEFYCDKSPRINGFVGSIVGDQISIGTPLQMEIYSETYYNYKDKLQGHTSLFNQLKTKNISCKGLEGLIGKFELLDTTRLNKKTLRDTVLIDIENRLKNGSNNKYDNLLIKYLK